MATDYTAGALRPTRTATLTRTPATAPAPAPAQAARTNTATTAVQTRQVVSGSANPLRPAAAGWVRGPAVAPTRTGQATATRTSMAPPAGPVGARQVLPALAAQQALVSATGSWVRATSTSTRTAAASTARGDGTGGSTVVRPVVGQLWPRARAAA